MKKIRKMFSEGREISKRCLVENKKFFCINMIFSVIIYFTLLSQHLVNDYDGLWHSPGYQAGTWEISIGRWLWPYLDVVRFHIQCHSLNTMMTLALMVIGNIFLIHIFKLKGSGISYLVSFLFLSSSLVCVSLSYAYMSPTFGMAYLLAMISAWCITQISDWKWSLALASISLAFSMGFYQAYVGSICSVMLAFFMLLLYKESSAKKLLLYVAKAVGNILCGGLLYFLILKFHLTVLHIKLSDYRGASDITILGILKNFPSRVREAYHDFYVYFFENEYKHSIFQWHPSIIKAIFAFIGLGVMLQVLFMMKKKKWICALLYFLSFCLFPLAINAMMIIAYQSDLIIQMVGAMALFFSVSLCLFMQWEPHRLFTKCYRVGFVLVMVAVTWGQILMVSVDQIAMWEGTNASKTVAEQIVTSLRENDFLYRDQKITFVGVLSKNETFAHSELFDKANTYAQFGNWWTYVDCNRSSWNGLLSNYCGVQLNFCDDDTTNKLLNTAEVKNMPVYPNDGSIQKIGDVVVVKVSD